MDSEGVGATFEDVDSRIRQDFSADQVGAVRSVLSRIETMSTESVARVHLAVLILAKGEWGRLEHFAERAAEDDRDVLYWAFYPDR